MVDPDGMKLRLLFKPGRVLNFYENDRLPDAADDVSLRAK